MSTTIIKEATGTAKSMVNRVFSYGSLFKPEHKKNWSYNGQRKRCRKLLAVLVSFQKVKGYWTLSDGSTTPGNFAGVKLFAANRGYTHIRFAGKLHSVNS